MGYNADIGLARGPLYLVTRKDRPFCGNLFVLFSFIAHQSIQSSMPSILKIYLYKINWYKNQNILIDFCDFVAFIVGDKS